MVVSVGKKRFWVDCAITSKAARASLATMLAFSLALQPVLVNAQIVADPNAGANYRPDIGSAPNGVPLVDIAAPNGQGLSHNKYSDFNVGRPGVVLNNHDREAGHSMLGGVVPGNPHLRHSGPASVILNEVTSNNRSALQGPVEVFGRQADVVIANPNGITCNGCGFINTPRATLATGIPEIGVDGGLLGFHISGGDVTFGPDGANMLSGKGAVDIFDIVSRSIRLEGPVAGHDISLIAGTGRFDYAGREMNELADIAGTPEYAIDGSALGALQAGRIKLVVTEKGAGVRMRSDMAANVGQIALSADGKISLNNVSGSQGVSVTSAHDTITARKIASKKTVALKAAKGIALQAAAAEENIKADAGDGLLSVAADMQAYGHIFLNTSAAVMGGQFASGRDLEIYAGNGIALQAAAADGHAILKTAHGDIIADDGIKAGGGGLVMQAAAGHIRAQTLISYHDAVIYAGRDVDMAGNILAAGNIAAQAGAIRAGGVVSGVDFAASDSGLVLKKTGETELFARTGDVMIGQIASGSNLLITAHGDISYDSVNSFGALDLVSDYGSISFDHSTAAAGDINLKAQTLDLSGNRAKITTGHTLSLHGQVINLSDSLLVYGGLLIDGSKIVEAYNSALNAVTSKGGSGNMSITAPALLTDQSTNLLAKHDLDITADTITNSGQMAAGHDLRLISRDYLHNLKTGLIFAGHDARLWTGGDVLNDQGAVIADHDMVIAGINGQSRNQSVVNVSGLIKAGNNATVLTDKLVNKRLAVPVWGNRSVSSGKVADFELNKAMRDKKYIYMHTSQHDGPQLFPGPLEIWSDYEPHLWSEAALDDGTTYRAWTWKARKGPDYEYRIYRWAAAHVLRDANGNPIIDPEHYAREFILNLHNDGVDNSLIYSWDWSSGISQTVYEDYLTSPLEAEAIIQAGNNLRIEADTITNSYSSMTAGGDADITSRILTNEGLTLNRTYLTTCHAQGTCSAYNADGERDPDKDIAAGTSVITKTEVIGTVSGQIKAGGKLTIKASELHNSAAAGSIAGGANYTPESVTGNPLDALNGLTAGGALFRPNTDLDFNRNTPKFDAGGFGGTLPGQHFIYETRADFIDIGKFYGSSYYLNRIGYKPDRQILFLGDAYFESQLIEKQMRDLAGTGLGKGSFIPGNSAIEQIKNLLDRGADYAKQHGLAFGTALTPQQQAALQETIVVYVKQSVNGRDVYAPVVYVAAEDRKKAVAGGAHISGGTVQINADHLNNSGTVHSAGGLQVTGITIKANGGTFAGRGDVVLAATGDMTLSAQAVNIGGNNGVNPNRMVDAGGNASLSAKNDLSLQGASAHAAGDMALSGHQVTLDASKVANNGSQNATGTGLVSGGSLTIAAQQNINVIGSSAKAGADLALKAREGSVHVATADVTRKVNDGFMQTTGREQQQSQLSAAGNTAITAGDDILVSGSKVRAGQDITIAAGDNVSISTAQEQKNRTWGGNNYWNTTSHKGSDLAAEGNVAIKAGNAQGQHDVNIIGSSVRAGGTVALDAAGAVVIAEAADQSRLHYKGKSGKERIVSDRESRTVLGSSLEGGAGVDIRSGHDTVISASDIAAGGGDTPAELSISAGGNVVVSSAHNTEEQHDRTRKKSFLQSSQGQYDAYDETVIGSHLSASGTIRLKAGEHAVIAGSDVAAAKNLDISGKSVSVIGGQEQHSYVSQEKKSGLGVGSGHGFYSAWGKQSRKHADEQTLNIGSSLVAGGDVSIRSVETDVNLMGSYVMAGGDIMVDGARDVTITPGHERSSSRTQDRRSGFGVQVSHTGSSASVGVGFGMSKDNTSESHSIHAKSGLSAGQDVLMRAGRDVNVQAADVAGGRDVALGAGRDVNLLSGHDVSNYKEMHETLFAGVKATVSSAVAGAVGDIRSAADRSGRSDLQHNVGNAVIAGSRGLEIHDSLKNHSVGISGNISAGFDHSKSRSWQGVTSPVTTGIEGGRSVAVVAEGGNIHAVGADVVAGTNADYDPAVDKRAGHIRLQAGGDITLESAPGSQSGGSSSKAGGGSIGVDLSGQPTGSGYVNKGRSQSSGVWHKNSHIAGRGEIALASGGDISLRGAVVSGGGVKADIGGNLTIESRADTEHASGKHNSVSGGFGSINNAGQSYDRGTGTAGFGRDKSSADYSSVVEQSGIMAGGDGFDITVKGNTDLQGGLIASKAPADKNHLTTGTITTSDIENHATASADSRGLSVSGGGELWGGKYGVGKNIVNNSLDHGKAADSSSGYTKAAIGAGSVVITDEAGQKQLTGQGAGETVAALNRDTDNAHKAAEKLDLRKAERKRHLSQA